MTTTSRTKGILTTALCALFLFLFPCVSNGSPQQDEMDRVLVTAETFFKVLKSGDFVRTWSLLSSRSKNTIVNDICKESQPSGGGCPKDKIAADLQAGGATASSYWKGFLSRFDPKVVLEESKWEIGYIHQDKAELLLTHKRSSNPARLQMFKEGGTWKVGLVETFWTRK